MVISCLLWGRLLYEDFFWFIISSSQESYFKKKKKKEDLVGKERVCTLNAYLAGYGTAFLNTWWNPASVEVQFANADESVVAALLSFPF